MRRKCDRELPARAIEQPRPFFADTHTGVERGEFPLVVKPATVDRDEAVARLNTRAVCCEVGNHARDDQAVLARGRNSDTYPCGRVEARKHHQAEVAQERRGAEMDPPRGARAWHVVDSPDERSNESHYRDFINPDAVRQRESAPRPFCQRAFRLTDKSWKLLDSQTRRTPPCRQCRDALRSAGTRRPSAARQQQGARFARRLNPSTRTLTPTRARRRVEHRRALVRCRSAPPQ